MTFDEWYEANERRFYTGHMNTCEVAYSAWCAGQEESNAPELLAALEAVEWVDSVTIRGELYCSWCGNYRGDGHAPDCQRQAAIAKATGEA